jgi:hypothetical protein
MNKAEQYMKNKGGVVHVHFEEDGTYIREDDVYRLMLEYHAEQLELTAVGYSTSVEQLYHKCREQDPAITKEEFNEALETWVWRYEKDQQVKNFKIEK